MKFVFVRLILTSAALFLSTLPTVAAEWNVGVSKVVITPESPTWLSGYGSRDKPAEGKVHELYAKALAFQSQDKTRLVLVTCDLGSMHYGITRPVAAAIEKSHGLPPGNLIINVSHTHCAPEVAAERPVFHNLSDEAEAALADYIDKQLIPKLTQLVAAALDDLAPSKILVSQSTATFGKSRRFPTEEGVVNRRYDEGITEDDVPVMQVVAPDGKLRAVMFGYACHNTTLAFYQYCGDYAGFAQHDVEAAHPGAVALFAMGCGGDQNPYPRHGPRGLEYCKQHGRELAEAVERAMQGEQIEVHGPLRTAHTTVQLPLEPLPSREELERDAENATSYPQRKAKYLLGQLDRGEKLMEEQPCPLYAARFGDELLFIAIGGETVVDYSRFSKAEFAGPMVWVAGYCTDVFAYLPSKRVLLEGGYEGRTGIVHQLTPTPFTPVVEDRVMGGLRKLVQQISR